MKASLLGKLRNTPFPSTKPLAPLYEAMANSFHAVDDTTRGEPEIVVTIHRLPDFLDEGVARPIAFTVDDTGIGFENENVESFFTSDSMHKSKRGARGNGRFLWLKAFDEVAIDSHFYDHDGELKRRKFTFSPMSTGEIPAVETPVREDARTTVKLIGLDEDIGNKLAKNTEWFAERIIAHFLPVFRSADCPKVIIQEEGEKDVVLNQVFRDTISSGASRPFVAGDSEFTLTSYRVSSPEYRLNSLVFAANEREVRRENLARSISGLDRKLDHEGHSVAYVGFVEGDQLNAMVRPDRLEFNPSNEENELFENGASISEIRAAAIDAVRVELESELKSIQSEKEDAIDSYVSNVAPEYRRLAKQQREKLLEALPSAPQAKQIESALAQLWMEKQVRLKEQGKQLLSHPPEEETKEAYKAQMHGFLDSFEELDHTALATHVTHRRVVLNLLDQALQRSEDTGKYQLEALIHRLIHPMRKSTEDIEFDEQNLWLLDDRLTYHDYLGSDLPLKSTGRVETDSTARPDVLAIYDRALPFAEGIDPRIAFSVIEFKRPERSSFPDRTPLAQVFDVVREIRDGQFLDRRGRRVEGASKDAPAYCFVVCDMNPAVHKGAVDAGGQLTPDGRGYFGWNPNLGIYFEVVSYEKLVGDALRRNRFLFKKLGLPTERRDR